MQHIDPNTLFSIFEQGDEAIYEEHGEERHLDNPYVLMGMVMRGIENYHLMDMMYLKKYPKEYTIIRKVTKYKYISKLYNYLLNIDSFNFSSEHSIGDSFDVKEVLGALDYLRVYYEEIEHYEKCAVIKRYIDLLSI